MFKSLVIATSVALAGGCSSAQQSEEVDGESEIASVDQAIGEAACATATPNAAASVSFKNSEVDRDRRVVNGAYQSTAAGCADSDILGLQATSVRSGSLSVNLNVSFSRSGLTLAQQQAECAQTSFKISHFKNGKNAFTTVGAPGTGFAALQLVEAGVPVVSNGRCINGVSIGWSVPRPGSTSAPDESRTTPGGKQIIIRSGMPVAADKATFVVQARDRNGALSEFDFRVDP